MNYDSFYFLSCILGDELYKLNIVNRKQPDNKVLIERFNQVWNQPIDDFYLSGLPAVIRRNSRREILY